MKCVRITERSRQVSDKVRGGRMIEPKKVMAVCGTCKYHHKETVDDGFVCTNPDSDYVADWTEDRKSVV